MDTPDTQDTQDTTDVNDFDAAFNDAFGESNDDVAHDSGTHQTDATDDQTDNQTDDAAEGNKTDDQTDDAAEGDEADAADDQIGGAAEGDKPDDVAEGDKPADPVAKQPDQIDPKFLAQAIAEAQAQREQAQREQAQREQEQKSKEQTPAEEEKPLTRADFLDEAGAAAIKKFETEWPDEYAAIQQLMQAELRAALANSFSGYTKQLNGVLAPLMGSVQKVEVNTYKGAVTAAHPDAFEIAPRVAEWIETQPAIVRSAYKQAYETGTAQEAIELLNLYKQATGSTGAAPATPASSAAQEPPKPKPVADKKAVAALAAVPAAQRAKPNGGADVLDFDAAFAEAAQALGNS